MANTKAITEYRPLTISITGADAPTNFIGAAKELIQDLEYQYNRNPSAQTDLTAVTTFIVGNHPHEGYAVTVTAVFATGEYTVEYVETRPNATNSI